VGDPGVLAMADPWDGVLEVRSRAAGILPENGDGTRERSRARRKRLTVLTFTHAPDDRIINPEPARQLSRSRRT
jgi:hypothetical protein